MYKNRLKIKFKSALEVDQVQLKSFEIAPGKALPPSYKDFCLELGYGRLFDLFRVYIPLEDPESKESLQYNMKLMKQMVEDYAHPFLGRDRDPEELELLIDAVPFARSDQGQYLYWKADYLLDDGEYPIYYADFSRGITGTHAGDSIPEMIERLTSEEYVRYILIFSPRPLNARFTAFRKQDLIPIEFPTLEQLQDLFRLRFLEMPFKDLLIFSLAVCEDLFRSYESDFIERRRVAEAGLIKDVFTFLKETISYPERYSYGTLDHFQKELQATNKKLSRKKPGYDETDQKLSTIGGNVSAVIYFLKTRDLIYLEGLMATILYAIEDEVNIEDPKQAASDPHFLDQTQRLWERLNNLNN